MPKNRALFVLIIFAAALVDLLIEEPPPVTWTDLGIDKLLW